MKVISHIIIVLGLLFIAACSDSSEKEIDLLTAPFIFEDGFETNEMSFDKLFPSDNSRWTTTQKTSPTTKENAISLTSSKFSEGLQGLAINAYQSDSQLSKMDIEKNGLAIYQGDKVRISADFYINNTESLENLLLIDLECCSCWDPTVGDNYGSENQCPGVRLILSGENNYLSMERGKIAGETIVQSEITFPKQEWVSILWEMTLSDDQDGINRLSINGTEVIDEPGMNMPNAAIFKQTFADEGIDFQLQSPVYYERVQIGATANPTAGDVEMYVDNFKLVVE